MIVETLILCTGGGYVYRSKPNLLGRDLCERKGRNERPTNVGTVSMMVHKMYQCPSNGIYFIPLHRENQPRREKWVGEPV